GDDAVAAVIAAFVHHDIADEIFQTVRVEIVLGIDVMRVAQARTIRHRGWVASIHIDDVAVIDLPFARVPRTHTVVVAVMMDDVVDQANVAGVYAHAVVVGRDVIGIGDFQSPYPVMRRKYTHDPDNPCAFPRRGTIDDRIFARASTVDEPATRIVARMQ